MKLIMCKGLPGSGKSTWAKAQDAKRINKDDLRAMLDNGKWSKLNEALILVLRNHMIDICIENGYDVIIDDTNLAPKHEQDLRAIAKELHVDFEIKDFTDVPLDECIRRDLLRNNSVGTKVILQMYNQYLKPVPKKYVDNPERENAIICDIDGTLALFEGQRSAYDTVKCANDKVNQKVVDILYHYADTHKIFIFSGREDKFRDITEEWLNKYQVPHHALYMRTTGDMRKDAIIKEELFDAHVRDKYNVRFVLDDRNQVVEMWRSLGLMCLQVAEGNF